MIKQSLERSLTDRLQLPVTVVAEPARISGGFWAAIHGFSITTPGDLPAGWNGPLVLRVMPNRTRAVHEIIVQRTVADSGFPTPPVLLDGFDESLGGAFMVMPFSAGKSPMSGFGPSSLLGVPRLLRRLPVQLAEVALRLHALDPQPVATALADAGLAVGGGAESRLEAIAAVVQTDGSGFAELLHWFAEHQPGESPRVVCHGDLHPFNLLVDTNGRTTVLDWTNADLMPREFEVGFTAAFLRCPPLRLPAAVQPVVARLTSRLARRFQAAYEQSVPLDRGMLAWFEALQHARCLAEVASARSGLSNIVDEHHPFETSAPAMTRRLKTLTGVAVRLPPRHVAGAG